MKKIIILLILLFNFVFAQRPVVIVTTEPQKAILERIVKGKIKIKTVFKDSDFKVKFKKLTLKRLASADIYMVMGLDIEKQFLKTVKELNPKLEIYNMTQGIKTIKNNGKVNPYLWMDPLKIRAIAEKLFLKFSKIDPANREFYETNYNTLSEELDELYLKIKMFYAYSNFSLYVIDDHWDYFAQRFDFPLYKFENRVLNAEEIPQFIVQSKKRRAKVLIIDPKTSSQVAKSLASNSNVKIIENDVFKYELFGNLFLFADTIDKMTNKNRQTPEKK
jgi:zinc transport system substrate-binding protein